MWLRFKRKREPVFTGNCMVRQHTGDGHSVGRCWHSTYDGVCPTHGDVSLWLDEPGHTWQVAHWPDDYDLDPIRMNRPGWARPRAKSVRG